MIKTCTCKHDWQDKRYGKQKRVHNEEKSNGGSSDKKQGRCTVCKTTN